MAMSNEGRLTAAARGGRISLYNTSSAELLATLIDPSMVAADMPVADTSHRDPVASLAIAPSGDLVASGSFRTIKLWKKSLLRVCSSLPIPQQQLQLTPLRLIHSL